MQNNELQEIFAPVIEAVSENPMLIVIWIMAFVIFIVSYILLIKASRFISDRYSFDAKVKKAKQEGRYATGTRVDVSRHYDYDRNSGHEVRHETWYATYSYEVDGVEYKKRFMSWKDASEPPLRLELYYKNNPKKTFTPYEYRWGGLLGLPLMIWSFLPFIITALFLLATGAVRP